MDNWTSHAKFAKRIVSILFMLTLLSSVSAAYFVNVDINFTSAKKSSHSSGGDSKNKGNGDSVGSNGNTGSNTTTPSIAQGTTTSATSINGAPLTPQQQYEQCLSGIGGGIPGNCKPPSATTTEQNVPPQTLSPQQTCQDGSTPTANGICQNGSTPQQACQGNVGRDGNGICFSPTPIITCPLHTVRDDTNYCVPAGHIGIGANANGSKLIGEGKLRVPTALPLPNTNTIVPICPSYSHLVGAKCVLNGYDCPSGYTQDEDICTPITPVHATIFVPPCASGYSRDANGGECLPIPPATPPSNTPPGQP